MKMNVIASVLAAVLLVGCGNGSGSSNGNTSSISSNSSGAEYLGKWQNVKIEKYTLEIERNGDSFIIHNTEPNSGDTSKFITTDTPATIYSARA